MSTIELLGSVGEVAAGILANAAAQAERPTPCEKWNVRELANHLVSGNVLFVAILSGAAPPDRNLDHLGADWAAAQRSSIAALLEGFHQPGVLGQMFRAPAGELPGAGLLHLRTVEQTVHGWDLAKATGQAVTGFNPAAAELYEPAAKLVAQLGGVDNPRHPFAEPHAVPADAEPIDRLVGLLGRDPGWQQP